MIDIQARLEAWLAGNPEAQRYVTKLYYVPEPEDEPVPEDATHVVDLSAAAAPDRALVVAAVVAPEAAAFLDSILALAATPPGRGGH